MIRTIKIYIYASLLVLGTYFQLKRVQKSVNQLTKEEIFIQPRSVSRKVMKRTGSMVMVNGQEKLPKGPVLFVANHQGLFDILTLLGHLGKPVGFIAKKEIQKLPIIASWMELVHCVFIDRTDRRQSVKAIHQGIENLKSGHSMVIFPEGTRSRGSSLNPFKPGSFQLALKANVPIVPVAIDGTYQMFEERNGRISPSWVTLTIEDAIFPEEYNGKNSSEIAEQVQSVIKRRLQIDGADDRMTSSGDQQVSTT
ncbi:1-acyl-sn-glycerol-3-phosphate acyltransferase [Virgibacillus sp. AGTR]|uniref:lysophospholipid acyltransferase family protein n=1 Tax=unclassified Virgibacillus TaxID=2620237 RepID=UPI000EF5225A|nr:MULTISPECIES: lysophospholipid acyltransferase family protein [unclassified Virgibacillus]MCC2251495.1 1-acyl-sn-glycerol-3-phosphate acyltransferase [Virgibacillus sp. AGTR]MDY7046472.1 lysophospholipid acyltransferase family protein [Virgibacillus sp. M23]QRZ19940.1 1-acyl-sn-glycerol-3-phosphate acyltransferase [Virgibacillus sp. AGTR]